MDIIHANDAASDDEIGESAENSGNFLSTIQSWTIYPFFCKNIAYKNGSIEISES